MFIEAEHLKIFFAILFVLGIWAAWKLRWCRVITPADDPFISTYCRLAYEGETATRELFTPAARECLAIPLGLEVLPPHHPRRKRGVTFRDLYWDTPAKRVYRYEYLTDLQAWLAFLNKKLDTQISMRSAKALHRLFMREIPNPQPQI
jgi:hypothetical protein